MMGGDAEKSKTPILDTYAVTKKECPEWPGVRRFIIPEQKKIIVNLSALDGKIDMIMHIGMGRSGG